MPRVDIPVADVVRTGTAIGSAGSEVTGDSSQNHIITNTGDVFVIARNSAATSTRNVTPVRAQNAIDGVTVTDNAVAVPISSSKILGPFQPSIYNNLSGADIGKMYLNVDHADLKLQAFRVPANR